MRNAKFGIVWVELQRMTRLAIRREIDALHEPAVRGRFVTIIAVEFLPVERRNVGREMPLMIEAQHIRIARVHPFQLEIGMIFPKRRERARESLRRPR